MMTLLAAPMMVRLPAMVLPAASASSSLVEAPSCISIGRYRATSGTFDISWLRRILIARITLLDVRFKWLEFMIDWKKPESQTLSIRMNMAAKKISVYQSIFLIIRNLLGLSRIIGSAEVRAM